MDKQTIRARAIELAIATYQMLPESKRTEAIDSGKANGSVIFRQMEDLADIYLEYINN
jgi:hypothetical protein